MGISAQHNFTIQWLYEENEEDSLQRL